MQIVSWNVKSCFLGKNKKNISKCRLLKILPRVLSVKHKKDTSYMDIYTSETTLACKFWPPISLGLLFKERICSLWEQILSFFPWRAAPFLNGFKYLRGNFLWPPFSLGLLFKERICSQREQILSFFPWRATPFLKGFKYLRGNFLSNAYLHKNVAKFFRCIQSS